MARPLFLPLSLGLLGVATVTAVACKATVNSDATATFGGTLTESAPQSSGDKATLPPAAPAAASLTTTYIGVTHALALTPDAAKNPKCTCLAAQVGRPGDPSFQWTGSVPEVGTNALVFALASEAAPCDARPAAQNRASIQAVERRGDDILITLEEAREGVPIAHGAVLELPRPPGSDSSIYIVPPRHVPYGHPLPGSTDQECRIKLP